MKTKGLQCTLQTSQPPFFGTRVGPDAPGEAYVTNTTFKINQNKSGGKRSWPPVTIGSYPVAVVVLRMQDRWGASSDESYNMTSSFDERRPYSILGMGTEQRATKSDPYLMEYFLNGGVRGILKKFQIRNQEPGQGILI